MSYYADKLETLRDLFGEQDVEIGSGWLRVGDHRFPIVRDVIILTDPSQRTPFVRQQLSDGEEAGEKTEYAEDIQYSFGEEWKAFAGVMPEHEKEFRQYFDVVDLDALQGRRVCDLGCGMGRWSWFLKDRCRELVLVDFSDAVFEARRNLQDSPHCLFFMADLQRLPFRDDFCDFLYCLGVLQTLPTDCLQETRRLGRMAPRILIFVYYALDNRPFHFRAILAGITVVRKLMCRVRHPGLRKAFSLTVAALVYRPLVGLGIVVSPLGLGRYVPLYEFYRGKSLSRIGQDVYDRFFTRIEQRVRREEVLALKDTFSEIVISDDLPYYHFLCVR